MYMQQNLHGCSTNINTNYNPNNYNYTLSYLIRKTALALNSTHSFPSISSCLGVLLVIWLSCHVTGSLTVFELLVIKYKISSVYSPERGRIVQDQSNDVSHEIHQIHFYSYDNKIPEIVVKIMMIKGKHNNQVLNQRIMNKTHTIITIHCTNFKHICDNFNIYVH